MSAEQLPVARLDRIARLRVLAAALPGSVIGETVFDAPFDEVWPWIADLERSVAEFDRDVASLRIVRREARPEGGERLRVHARNTGRVLWIPAVLDVDLEPGWCWMASRPQAYLVGMAAEPDGERTRFAHLEGVTLPAPRALQPLLRPILAVSRWRHERHIPHDLAGMAAHVNRR